MSDSNQKSLAPVFLTLGAIWLAGMATLFAISQFQGLKGVVALSFAALCSSVIASLGSVTSTAAGTVNGTANTANKTESEETMEWSMRLASGESPFKLLIPFFKFLILVLSLYLVIYFSVAPFFDGMQMAWAFIASLILVGIAKMVLGKENPLQILSNWSCSTTKKSFVGTFLVVGVLVTLTFCGGLMALPIQTYPIAIRALIVLTWFCCYFKLICWIRKKCGGECAVPDTPKNDSLDRSDGPLY